MIAKHTPRSLVASRGRRIYIYIYIYVCVQLYVRLLLGTTVAPHIILSAQGLSKVVGIPMPKNDNL